MLLVSVQYQAGETGTHSKMMMEIMVSQLIKTRNPVHTIKRRNLRNGKRRA